MREAEKVQGCTFFVVLRWENAFYEKKVRLAKERWK